MSTGPLVAKVVVAALIVCHAAELPAPQWSGEEYRNLTLRRLRTCVENEQYPHQGLCCVNCKEGTFVQKPCEGDLEEGTCVSCEHGQTYTEHPNGMNRCLPCTHCRPGNQVLRYQRIIYLNVILIAFAPLLRHCRCKAGEEEVKNCTPFSNTVCRKRDPSPTETVTPRSPPVPDPPTNTWFLVLMVLICIVVIVVFAIILWFLRKQHSCDVPCKSISCESSEIVKIPIDESGATAEEKQNNQNAGLEGEEPRPESRPLLQETQPVMTKACPPLEDEDRGLGDSLPNTTSSSQTSLSALPTAASTGSTPHHSPAGFRQLPSDTDDPLGHRLLPLLGSEKSLRKSFDLFDEYLDVRIHNKFFRLIGISDNHIRIAESGAPGDKVYELLKNWMQRQGLKADINDLLEALLSMDQRRSAECIAHAALRRGYYKHADTP
uniref:Tumor necrosis factor receptor superfamily, member a n=1 Tax=Xiphophorus couchianus TaxID=32473 RepID=A0A3B5MW51_9TELE